MSPPSTTEALQQCSDALKWMHVGVCRDDYKVRGLSVQLWRPLHYPIAIKSLSYHGKPLLGRTGAYTLNRGRAVRSKLRAGGLLMASCQCIFLLC